MCDTPSIASTTILARSPIAAQATPKKNRKDDDLEDLVFHQRTDGRIGEDMLDEAVEGHGMCVDARIHAGHDLVDAEAWVEGVHEDKAECQRHERGRDKPQHCLAADATDGSRVRHVADADDQRREDQRAYDHLDQAQEDHRTEREVAREQLLGCRGSELFVNDAADADAQQHGNEDIRGHTTGLHYVRLPCCDAYGAYVVGNHLDTQW